ELRNAGRAEPPVVAVPVPPPAQAIAVAPAVPPAPPPERPSDPDAPARLFFAFLEPFFVDDVPENLHVGRLSRAAAAPVWEWIGRDLLPTESIAYAGEVARLAPAGDAKAGQAAAAFHERVAQAIEKTLVEVT